MKTQGDRVRFIRTNLGLTQVQFGEICGVSHAAVNQWEKNSSKAIKSAHLFAIQRRTGYSAEWIDSGEGSSTVNSGQPLSKGSLCPILEPQDVDSWIDGSLDSKDLEHLQSVIERSPRTFAFIAPDDGAAPLIAHGKICFVDPDIELPGQVMGKLLVLIRKNNFYAIRLAESVLGEFIYKPVNASYQSLTAAECELVGVVSGIPEETFSISKRNYETLNPNKK